jgi:hypothetical protein
MRDFNHTVNVLVQAYLKNELEHSKCSACAVGNIVAEAIGTKPGRHPDVPRCFMNSYFDDGRQTLWQAVFMTSDGKQSIDLDLYDFGAKDRIDATGYSVIELASIEKAFELAPRPEIASPKHSPEYTLNEEWMFNGLMAVVDVLAEIHGVDLTQKEQAKLLFVK